MAHLSLVRRRRQSPPVEYLDPLVAPELRDAF